MPAEANTGLRFRLNDRVTIPALVDYVIDTSRATVIGAEGESVSTVEHLLSSLVGLEIDNALIVVEGPEIPVLDGSSLPFTQAIAEVGMVEQGVARRYLNIGSFEVIDRDMRLSIVPADQFIIEMDVEFRPPIGAQRFAGEMTPAVYEREIAGARTFGYLDEVEALRARGLAMGGSLDNAVVFSPDGPMQPLRFADEPVRHKVLDLLGDFALIGAPLLAKIQARKSGHALHAKAVRALRERLVLLP
jgi:UDP-3-O-[3-hydroxymyristoyl] N-acetylglucosamine deacetylase